MTLVMSYVILIAAGVGACTFLAETVARSRAKPGRWLWAVSLALTALATILAMVVPRASDTIRDNRLVEVPVTFVGQATAQASTTVSPARAIEVAVGVTDAALPLVWIVATTILLIAIGFGRRRLHRERIRAERAQLAGHGVLLTEDVGPAVAGIREPVVFVPRWVLALDDPSQRLLMAHEMEHVQRRDTALLFAGAMSAAVMPWNPVVWWMVSRLRLAVEQDCDARVLAVYPGVRRYADLLLTAASRHGLKSRLLAAHLGEHTSDLLKRIEAMTSKDTLSWRKLTVAAFAAVALVAVACETPRPDPVAPIGLDGKASTAQADTVEIAMAKSESKNSVVVLSSDGKEVARYAGEIPVSHLPPDGIQSIKAEESPCASGKCFAVRIMLKPDRSLNLEEIEKAKLPYKIRADAEVSAQEYKEFKIPELEVRTGEKVMLMKDGTLIPLDKSLPGRAELSGTTEVLLAKVIPDSQRPRVTMLNNERARVTMRDWANGSSPIPNIVIVGADGSELRRFLASDVAMRSKSLLDELKTDDIAAIEVYKGNSCPTTARMPCPLVRVTLKAGREAAYRK